MSVNAANKNIYNNVSRRNIQNVCRQ